jgi:CRP/FNR family cyclic AMP-dependent transcriptional regulator
MKMTARRIRNNRTERIVAETSEWVPANEPHADQSSAMLGAPVFDGMSPADIAAALSEFDEVRYPSGRRIVLEGRHGKEFFLVVVGSAAVLVDGRRVATLGPGDYFGEIAVLGDGLRSATVSAETPLVCLVLPNDKLERLILDHPQLGINLIRSVIGRLRKAEGPRVPSSAEDAPGPWWADASPW